MAVFGSITVAVFASRMHSATAVGGHPAVTSVGAAAEIAHRAGGAYGADLLHTASSAFVTGADHAVIAGPIHRGRWRADAVRTLRTRDPRPRHRPCARQISGGHRVHGLQRRRPSPR